MPISWITDYTSKQATRKQMEISITLLGALCMKSAISILPFITLLRAQPQLFCLSFKKRTKKVELTIFNGRE